MPNKLYQLAGQLSRAIHHGEPAEKIEQIRRDLAAARLERYVSQLVADWPPLTDEQRDKIVSLLHGAEPADTDSAPQDGAQ